jgi:hypothetical protein
MFDDISLKGFWQVSVVSDGRETFPFGNNYLPNMMLSNGLDILNAGTGFLDQSDDLFIYNTVSAFLYGNPVLGTGVGALNSGDTSLFGYDHTATGVKSNRSNTIDIPESGIRIFDKTYDFNKPSFTKVYTEAGMVTDFSNLTGFNSNTLFSKFLFPDGGVTVSPSEWLRLRYRFYAKCGAITGSQVISASNDWMTGDGEMRLCGKFDDIFGSMNVSDGKPYIMFGDSPRGSFLPYQSKFFGKKADWTNNECFATAFIVKTGVSFPNINESINIEWLGDRLSEEDGSISAGPFTSNQGYRDITYTLKSGNPNGGDWFGGILFTVTKRDRNNTWDGWLWKFNSPQYKPADKELRITIRQSVSECNII